MATSKQMVSEIAAVTGTARSAINTITRRLSEADIVARGVRGHAIPNMPADSISNMILGALVLGDGYNNVSARIVERVNEVRTLQASGDIELALDDSIAELDKSVSVIRDNTFAAIVSNLLVGAVEPETSSRLDQMIVRIGVSFSSGSTEGWIEWKSGFERAGFVGGPTMDCNTAIVPSMNGFRLVISRGTQGGVTREVSIDWRAIKRLAEIGAKGNPEWGA